MWEFTSAHDISDDGKVIVGMGRNPEGKSQAWMLSLRGGVPGDFDMSGSLTAIDIEMLSTALMGEVWLGFDLNQDGHVNADDSEFWVHELANTWYGDANVDGEFNSSDLVSVFRAGHYEDAVDGNSGWKGRRLEC